MLKKLLSVSVLMAFAGGYTQVQGKGNLLPSKGISLVSSEGMSNKSGIALPITGKITSSDGEALPGVTIKIKGTARGTITGGDGSFKLDVPDANTVLVISSTGFETQEVTVGSRSVINVVLANDIKSLEEVVVVGYGERKKSDVTGAMVSVGSAELNQRPVANALQGMQGRAAGVDIQSNERPGQAGKVTIRGVRSLTASNEPLYVVDGIPLVTGGAIERNSTTGATSERNSTGGIDNINPNDIESVDVLKDASATAIYGSRGANGVVLITTKRGKNGKYTLSLNSNFTAENIVDLAPMMNAGEYIDYRRWAYYYTSTTSKAYPRGDQPTQTNDFEIFSGGSDKSAWANIMKGWAGGTWDGSKVATTDWLGMVTQTALTGQHTLSVSGGTEKMKAYASFGYLNNQGTIKGQGYKRYTGKLSVDITPSKWFSMGGILNTAYSVNEYGQSGTAANVQAGLYASARRLFSYAVPFDEAGNRILQPGNDPLVFNIVDEEKYSQDQRVNLRLFGSFYGELNFGGFSKALEGLKYRMNFGPDVSINRNGFFINALSVANLGGSTNAASLTKFQSVSYTLDNLLTYNKTIGKSQIGLTALQTQTQYEYESNFLRSNNVAFPSQKWNNLDTAPLATTGGYNSDFTQKALVSYMGRVNYDYDNKYLLTVSGRADGASQLAEGNKWSFFPSMALGWRINNERFLAEKTWIDALKLRAGVGVTGNASINPYDTQGALVNAFYPSGASILSGLVNNKVLANQTLSWEKTTQYNYGIDFSLFRRKISGSLDFYTANTKDLLMLRSLPPVTGYPTTNSNVGETASRGLDLTLTTINLSKAGFEWSSTFNGSWQENEIVTLSQGKFDDINNKWFIGQSQGVIYDYQANGLWKESDTDEMAKFNANGSKFSAGMVRPVDLNGDYKIDANNDRKVLGSTIPKFIVGLTNNFEYKGLSLSVMLYGRLSYLYNTGGESLSGRSSQRQVSYYTPNNTNSEFQRPFFTAATGDPYSPSLGYKDGSFIKVRNISLGYRIPEKICQKLGVSNARVYVQGQNLGMLYNNISWLDMDVQLNASNRGYTFGINLDL
jgi:TonB-linked SusC/RagA family outer membrane protein